jgi:hypothetical protein
MPQQFLRAALVDAVAHAQGLKGFPKGVEVHHAPEIINTHNVRPLEITQQAPAFREDAVKNQQVIRG